MIKKLIILALAIIPCFMASGCYVSHSGGFPIRFHRINGPAFRTPSFHRGGGPRFKGPSFRARPMRGPGRRGTSFNFEEYKNSYLQNAVNADIINGEKFNFHFTEVV